MRAIELLLRKASGLGGIIGISRDGEYAFAHNTQKMAFDCLHPSGQIVAQIKLHKL